MNRKNPGQPHSAHVARPDLPGHIDRRTLLKVTGSCFAAAGLTTLAGVTGNPGAVGAPQRPRHFVHIHLRGGWDALMATDPLDEARFSSDAFDVNHKGTAPSTVVGKDALLVGAGLAPAIAAFTALPTAFVNGLFNEVTGHALAENYMYSGRQSLSATRVFPSLSALVGQAWGGAPSHVVFGASVPLGETAFSNPPIMAPNIDLFAKMIAKPDIAQAKFKAGDSLTAGNELVAQLDKFHRARQPADASALLEPWTASRVALEKIHAGSFDRSFALTDEVRARYGIEDNGSIEALLAAAFTTLSSRFSRVVTVNMAGFDTHTEHFDTHLPLLMRFATALDVFASDLASTEDPAQEGRTLADTTLVYITSDFTRTPALNAQRGTDHWPSGSAILMGCGVADGKVFGKTDARYKPMGWQGNKAVALTDATRLSPERLSATLLATLGLAKEAQALSPARLEGLFV